jgi:hypothetical protein
MTMTARVVSLAVVLVHLVVVVARISECHGTAKQDRHVPVRCVVPVLMHAATVAVPFRASHAFRLGARLSLIQSR